MTKFPIALRFAWLFLLLLPAASSLARSADHLPLPVMDLQRFSGHWHQLAWLPVDFQRKCASQGEVRYVPRPDEGFDLHRSCLDDEGRRLEDTAVVVPVPGAPGSLQVRSAPRWRAWLPIGWERRWVVAVDPGYEWALVGSPDRDRLWVLSRQPTMDRLQLASLVERVRVMGYPVEQLVFAPDAYAGEARRVPARLVVLTNEPFWQAQLQDDVLRLSGPGLPQARTLRVDMRRDMAVPGVQRIVARDAHGEVVVQVATESCQDDMSGAWFPLRASLSIDGDAPVRGCARPANAPPPGEPR